jgi:chromosome segregation ATPase
MVIAVASTTKPQKTRTALAAVPELPSLEARLAEARRAAVEPNQRAAGLTVEFGEALAREDYTEAARLREELRDARQEAALADASVTALETALTSIDIQAAEENRTVQQARQQASARQQVNTSWETENELMGHLNATVAAVFTGLADVQQTIANALSLESQITQVRNSRHLAQVQLGEAEPVRVPLDGPNPMRALIEQDHTIGLVANWSR